MDQHFEGVIGRDWRDVDAVVAARARSRRRARRTCCSSCSTTSASRSSAATAPTSRRRPSTGSPPTASGSPTSTRPRSARRPARACSPGATTTATAWAASPTSRSGYPRLLGPDPARERLPLRDPARRTATRRYAVGKWHLTPEDETHMAAPRESWPLGRGFDRWYGFHGGETHQFVPSLYHDNHSVLAARAPRGRLPPERRPRRPRDRVPRRPARGRRRPTRSSSTSRPARATRRTTRRRSGSSATAASSTTAGTRGARRRSPASSRAACSPRGTAAVAAPALGAGVGLAEGRGPRRRGPLHGVLRRVPVAHRRADRPRARRSSSETGDLDNTVDRRCAPTTAPAPRAGRRARSTTAGSGTARPRAGASCARASTRSAARPRTTTTRGAGRWPATRRSSAGSARCTRAASPTRASCRCRGITDRGRDPPPVRARDRRAAHDPRARRHRARRTQIDGVAQSPVDGTSFASVLRDADAPEPHDDPVLRDARLARHLPRRLEGGDVPPARRDVRRRPRPRRAVRRRRVGALRRGRRPVRDQRPRRRANPNGSRRWSSCGGRRPRATTCSRSTTVRCSRS